MDTKPESQWYASKDLRRMVDRWMALTGKRQGDLPKEADLDITGEMLSMIIKRRRTLTPRNAVGIAKALHCSIYEICPEMAEFVIRDMVPVLGKALRRAAAIAALALGITATTGFDNKSFASSLSTVSDWSDYTLCRLMRLLFSILDVPFRNFRFSDKKFIAESASI